MGHCCRSPAPSLPLLCPVKRETTVPRIVTALPSSNHSIVLHRCAFPADSSLLLLRGFERADCRRSSFGRIAEHTHAFAFVTMKAVFYGFCRLFSLNITLFWEKYLPETFYLFNDSCEIISSCFFSSLLLDITFLFIDLRKKITSRFYLFTILYKSNLMYLNCHFLFLFSLNITLCFEK